MARLRYNGLNTGSSGSIVALALGASLTNVATSVTFNAALTHSNGTAVPTITGSDFIPLAILDTNGHLSEIVYLTAYTAAATTGTISRGKEGTSGVAHSSGDKIAQAPLGLDLPGGYARLRRSATQTISSGSWTALTWNTEDFDTLGWHDTVTNNSRVTVTSDGVYQLVCSINLGSSSGTIYTQFSVNGTRIAGRNYHPVSGITNASIQITRVVALSATDYVEANIFASGGATLTIIADDESVFDIARIGAL